MIYSNCEESPAWHLFLFIFSFKKTVKSEMVNATTRLNVESMHKYVHILNCSVSRFNPKRVISRSFENIRRSLLVKGPQISGSIETFFLQ